MACVILGLGSNLGDRRLNLSKAVRGIATAFNNFEVSHVIESKPWGYESENSYLNMCMIVNSDLCPEEILQKIQDVERSISSAPHRDSKGKYTDREIDIDILAIDNLVIDTPELKVPHPEMPKRSFVLEPMMELVPGWKHPVSGKTPVEMLYDLPQDDK